MVIRQLGPGDRQALTTFLDGHRASSMFLRSNLQLGGLDAVSRSGLKRYQGVYVGAFKDDALTDVAAHYWNNNIILQAPNAPVELASAVAHESGRIVNGVIGPWAQVKAAEPELDLDRARLGKVVPEYLYALNLKASKVPQALIAKQVQHRHATNEDIDLLVKWRRVYDRITMGFPESAIDDNQNRDVFNGMISDCRLWVLEDDGTLVAMANFSASLPDTVQVGGVYTDEASRGRGYARSLVAGMLRDAQKSGVEEALLFTEMDNMPAQRAYESLGFEQVGDYGMVVLDPS